MLFKIVNNLYFEQLTITGVEQLCVNLYKEQRTKNKEQRTKNKEQRTKNKEQRTKNKEQRCKLV